MVVDTSIFIEHFRATDKTRTAFWSIPDDEDLYISVVTLYELSMGATTPAKEAAMALLLQGVTVLPMTEAIAKEAAGIYRDLRKRNKMIGHRDIFIAATAKTHGFTIKTNNRKDFSRVPGLQLT